MLTPAELANIKNFKPNDIVCVFSKGRPVICSVVSKQNKNNTDGFQLKVLDIDVIEVLGQDTLWVPTKMIDSVGEA
jgi:hypothetical protein